MLSISLIFCSVEGKTLMRMMVVYSNKKPAPCFKNRVRLFIVNLIYHSKDKIHADAGEALQG
jgi:hypothetical protein